MREIETQEIEIVYPDECPKCRQHKVLHSDWSEGQFIFLTLYCQECGHRWREVIDLDI